MVTKGLTPSITLGLAMIMAIALAQPGPLAADPDDIYWDDQFGALTGIVSTGVDMGTELYVGGYFMLAGGGLETMNILRWSGSIWSTVDGVFGADSLGQPWVHAMSMSSNGDLYVAGQFKTIDAVVVNNIAKWDGNSWSPLGSGVESDSVGLAPGIFDIALLGNDLYVAGQFTTAGGAPAGNIAKWDGTGWSALGGGTNGVLRALAVANDGVYVGGYFVTDAGGVPVQNLAKWDFMSGWMDVGGGVPGVLPGVHALAVDGNVLYVGGGFDQAGTVPADNIAAWDGTQWSPVGGGVDDYVSEILVDGSNLYVGGAFTSADGDSSVHLIGLWNGSGWSALGDGVEGPVYYMVKSGGDLIAGGGFSVSGATWTGPLVKWDGARWLTFGRNGLDRSVAALAVDANGLVYAGGHFRNAFGEVAAAKMLATWDGNQWSAITSDIEGDVNAIAIDESNLYVGGFFTSLGGLGAVNIAKWDGSTWSILGGGVDGSVYAIAIQGNDVYVGGQFGSAGGQPAFNIAKWDGSSWSDLFFGVDGIVTAIETNGGDVYVGGWFTHAGGLSANRIARWDGSQWSSLGSGVNGITVWTIATLGSDVFIGGDFDTAGGVSANRIARWDGTQWSSLASGVDGGVFDLAAQGAELVVAGNFTQAGGVVAPGIARWDGANWFGFGNGINGQCRTLAIHGDDIYVGGYFGRAGNFFSSNFAHWNKPTATGIGDQTLPTGVQLKQNYPNPFNPTTIIRYEIAVAGRLSLRIYDVTGALVKVLEERAREPGRYEIGWDGDNERGEKVSSGVYFYRLRAPGFSRTRKMVLLK